MDSCLVMVHLAGESGSYADSLSVLLAQHVSSWQLKGDCTVRLIQTTKSI